MIRAAVLCVALTACAQPVIQAPPMPPLAQCDATCRTECNASGIRYDPAADSINAIDDIVQQVVIPLRSRIDQCEISRLACQQCVDRLIDAGVAR